MRARRIHFDGETYEPDKDWSRLTSQLDRVRHFLLSSPGAWFSLREIEDALGYPQASISARIRDLRKSKFGGYDVDRRRRKDIGGTFEYTIRRWIDHEDRRDEPSQQEMEL